MSIIRDTVARIIATIKLMDAEFFDLGLDALLSEALKLDAQLDGFIEAQHRKHQAANDHWLESWDRQQRVADAEIKVREQANAIADKAIDEIQRAKRVRDRIKALVD
ncbi:hypothetical protein [Novosphingobium meiothermophilum]|uniref:hypothetical protein n=1 Tax=Novosphingobium meiothermophilum TaxID=2202251 RepID=UPI000D6DD834|nr:hypothetical protein [Novosphingobium meiothermophilum]